MIITRRYFPKIDKPGRKGGIESKYILGLLLSWVIFFCFMTAYSYSYMLITDNSYYSSWQQAFQCVLKDWIVWVALSPLLLRTAAKHDISTQEGLKFLARSFLICILFSGTYRVLVEYWVQGYDAIKTIYVYFPRYIVASLLTLLTCTFYAYKLQTEAQIRNYKHQIHSFEETMNKSAQSFVVYKGRSKAVINAQDIIYVRVNGNYLEIHTKESSYLMRKTMKEIETQLAADQFIRIHRSYIVRRSEIHTICRNSLEAKMHNNQRLRIGKKYLKSLPHFHQAESNKMS